MTVLWRLRIVAVAAMLSATSTVLRAHDGPPFPIVSNQTTGPYVISVWTDPDTTDDGTAEGKFWVMAKAAASEEAVPLATRATVTITPLDRQGTATTGTTEPVDGDIGRQFVALVMDHEGRFGVRVTIDGSLGPATIETEVEATYDTRPSPLMLLIYIVPFVLVGGLWMRALGRRKARVS